MLVMLRISTVTVQSCSLTAAAVAAEHCKLKHAGQRLVIFNLGQQHLSSNHGT
jgi:hypothetical protein